MGRRGVPELLHAKINLFSSPLIVRLQWRAVTYMKPTVSAYCWSVCLNAPMVGKMCPGWHGGGVVGVTAVLAVETGIAGVGGGVDFACCLDVAWTGWVRLHF